MVEVGIRDDNVDLQENIEMKLENLRRNFSCQESGQRVYRGHPAMYTDLVNKTMKMVQRSGGLNKEILLCRKSYWHEDFSLILAKNLEEFNYLFGIEIVNKLAMHTKEDRPVIWITPVGPMGHYPVIAEIMNKMGQRIGLHSKLIFPFAMDEWSDENGNLMTAPEFKRYIPHFAHAMNEQFYNKLRGRAKIPRKNMRFAAGEGLRSYVSVIEKLFGKDAGVVFTGGVGMTGHIMFWEPTFGTLLGKEISEKVTYIRGAPLTTETIAQNRFTSAASAPVPCFANTIGLGLFCMLRDYGEKNPNRVNVVFGLDNAEEPLIWQRYIAHCTLAMEQSDPSLGASYPPTVPGAYIMVENHMKGFKVPAK